MGKLSIAASVCTHEENGQKYLINSETGKIFNLNPVAGLIVEGIEAQNTLSEIEDNVGATFNEASSEQISEDVRMFIKLLKDNGCIVEE